MTKNKIFLVGFMGAGKSAIGARLARALKRKFIDLDERIESQEGKTIRQIFDQKGEPYFRRIEHDVLLSLEPDEAVVALGGGAFCFQANRKYIRQRGPSIWLDAPLELILERGAMPDRPLFKSPEEVSKLLERRRAHYAKADYHVAVQRKSPVEIVREILDLLERKP